jgi:hypothetical protein
MMLLNQHPRWTYANLLESSIIHLIQSTTNIPLGKMCVHLLRLDVNLIVTLLGSNGLIKARPVLI